MIFSYGNGTFATPVSYQVPSATGVTIGDYTHDGSVDIANTNINGGSITVLINNGKGVFTQVIAFAVSTDPAELTTADFNGDGKLDIACTGNSATNGIVSVLINTYKR